MAMGTECRYKTKFLTAAVRAGAVTFLMAIEMISSVNILLEIHKVDLAR